MVLRPNQRSPRRRQMCVALGEFLERDVPQSTELLGKLILAGSVGMLVAPRGCGKSLLAMTIGYAVAGGKLLAPWGIGSGDEVCLIDGEMREEGLQTRLRLLHAKNTRHNSIEMVTRKLHIISRDAAGDLIGSIDTMEGQEAFDKIIPDTAKLIIIDNLSALTTSGREDAASFALIKQWIIKKRLDGVAVLLVHHTGKSGTQRGTSVHEDLLDYAIKLSPRDDESGKTAFILEHTKLRDHLPQLRGKFHGVFWTEDGRLEFEIKLAGHEMTPDEIKLLQLQEAGLSLEAIAKEFGVKAKTTIMRRLQRLKERRNQSDSE